MGEVRGDAMQRESFEVKVEEELQRARLKNAPFNSLHEAYAVLLEEVDELWDEVKKKPAQRDKFLLLQEAVQVGAVIRRLVEDLLL
jgi:hypothetical protein